MLYSHNVKLWRATMVLDEIRIVPPPGKAPVDWSPIFDMRPGRVITLYDFGGPMWRSCYEVGP